jgi:hypothetical protein
MLCRAPWLASFLLLAIFSGLAQKVSKQQSPCVTPNCMQDLHGPSATYPDNRQETLDYNAGKDAAIPCAVAGYVSDGKPQVHLLCPGPQIFAPLHVLLVLSWLDAKDVPASMKSSQLDMKAAVRFKSKPGKSMAELTLRDGDARPQKEWISFNKVSVSLVMEPAK